jgi:hypothetical protein
MNRHQPPIYEGDSDRANEDAVAEVLRVRWKWDRLIKLPKLRRLDRVAIRGKKDIAGYVEVKCRPGLTYGYGDGYYIAATKVIAAIDMLAIFGVGTILAVRFIPDVKIWWTPLRGPYRGIWAGRMDRPDDPYAMEEHAVIPWDQFKEIAP